jgi:hypothetical protein
MNFKNWLESRDFHLGMDPDQIDPLKENEEIRVYHGFYSINDAINIALHGTSGKMRAKRVYSYESENNPRGMFITLDLKTAKKNFAAGTQPTVMQFVVKEDELEPPTWPGGGWTGQGQMAKYFYEHPAGSRLGRIEKIKQDKEEAKQSKYKSISQSHRPELANLLFGSEMQALFVGHLEANRIEGFHVQRQQKEYRRVNDPWEFISREQFIKEFSNNFNYERVADDNSKYRIFTPNQDFDWQQIAKYFNDKYRKSLETEVDVYNFIGVIMPKDFKKAMSRDVFESTFSQYFWPKQLPQLHRWIMKMKRSYGNPS